MWMGRRAFFAFGNSNSLATIDIGNAYMGLSSYNAPIVALFTFLINYSGPLLFFFFSLMLLLLATSKQRGQRKDAQKEEEEKKHHDDIHDTKELWLSFSFLQLTLLLFAAAVFCVVMTALRHHLFIWSVFAPKYFYFLFDMLASTLEIVLLLGVFFVWPLVASSLSI
ncbi:major facilitator superfamily transporter protein [Balamuthia mandrillaris]